jgi:hypothetical protein
MRILFGAAIVAFLLLPSLADDVWKTYRDEAGTFSVQMPGMPKLTTTSSKTDDGREILINTYALGRGSSAFIVMIGDYTAYNLDGRNVIKGAIGALGEVGKKVQSNRPDSIDGHDGREVSFIDGTGPRYTDRLFFVNKRLYQVMTVLAPNADPAQQSNAARFNASFHFTAQ